MSTTSPWTGAPAQWSSTLGHHRQRHLRRRHLALGRHLVVGALRRLPDDEPQSHRPDAGRQRSDDALCSSRQHQRPPDRYLQDHHRWRAERRHAGLVRAQRGRAGRRRAVARRLRQRLLVVRQRHRGRSHRCQPGLRRWRQHLPHDQRQQLQQHLGGRRGRVDLRRAHRPAVGRLRPHQLQARLARQRRGRRPLDRLVARDLALAGPLPRHGQHRVLSHHRAVERRRPARRRLAGQRHRGHLRQSHLVPAGRL